MIPTTTLFDLIQSLSKAEKRHFKIQATKQGNKSSKNTVVLFDYIEKQKVYDEQLLKKTFLGKTFTKQLTASKYYLYHQILKSLKQLNESKSPEGTVLSILQYIPVLNQKKLYEQSLNLLKRAKNIALENELYVLLFESLSIEERTLYFLKNNQISSKQLEALHSEKQQCLTLIQNQSTYQNFRLKIFTLIKEERFSKNSKQYNELKKELNKTILQNPPSSHSSVYNMHYSVGLIYFHEKDFTKSFNEYKNLLIYIDKNPILKNDIYKSNYLNAAQNCIVAATYIPVYDKFISDLIHKLETQYKNNTEYTLLILRLKLALYIGASKYNEGTLAVDKTKNIQSLISKAEHYIFVDIVFCCAQLYMWTKDYKKSIKWFNKLIKFENIIFPRYVYIISLLMEIFIHIELKNYRLVKSLCASFQRTIEDEKDNHSIELKITSIINKRNKYESIDSNKALYKEIATYLDSQKEHESTKNLMLYFNLPKWLKQVS